MAHQTVHVALTFTPGGPLPEVVTVERVQRRAQITAEVQLYPVSTEPGGEIWIFSASDDVSLEYLLTHGLRVEGMRLSLARKPLPRALIVAWSVKGAPLPSFATTTMIMEEVFEEAGYRVTAVADAVTGLYTFEAIDQDTANKIVETVRIKFQKGTQEVQFRAAAAAAADAAVTLSFVPPPPPPPPPRRKIFNIEIFHDGENCPIPSEIFERDSAQKLVVAPGPGPGGKMRPKVIPGAGGARPIHFYRLYDSVLRSILAKVEGEAVANQPDRLDTVKVSWNFVLNWVATNPFHPTQAVKEDMTDLNVSLRGTSKKPGAVDTLLKRLLVTDYDSLEKRWRKRPDEEKDGFLVVLIAGDRDYAGEVASLRRSYNGYSGLEVIVLFSKDAPPRAAFLSLTPLSMDNWTDLVESARVGGHAPILAASADRVGPAQEEGDSPVIEILLTKSKLRFLRTFDGLNDLQELMCAIHWAFVIDLTDGKNGAKGRVSLKTDTRCEASVGSAVPPTDKERATASQALKQKLSDLIEDNPILLPGVSTAELLSDQRLKRLCDARRVCSVIPGLNAKTVNANSTAPTLRYNQAYVSLSMDLSENEIKQICQANANITIHQFTKINGVMIATIDIAHNRWIDAARLALVKLRHPHCAFSLSMPSMPAAPTEQIESKVILTYWKSNADGAAEIKAFLNRKVVCSEDFCVVQDAKKEFVRLKLFQMVWPKLRRQICIAGLSQLQQKNALVQLRGTAEAVEEAIAILQAKTQEVSENELSEQRPPFLMVQDGIVVRTLQRKAWKASCQFIVLNVKSILSRLTGQNFEPTKAVGGKAKAKAKGKSKGKGKGKHLLPPAVDDNTAASESDGENESKVELDETGIVQMSWAVSNFDGTIQLAFFLQDKERADEVEGTIGNYIDSYGEESWTPPMNRRKEAVDAAKGPRYLQTLSDDFDLNVKWENPQNPLSLTFQFSGDCDQIKAVKQHLAETFSTGQQGMETVMADRLTLALLRLSKHQSQRTSVETTLKNEFGKLGVKVLPPSKGALKDFVLKVQGPKGHTPDQLGPVQLAKSRGEELVRAFRAQMGESQIELTKSEADYLFADVKQSLNFMGGKGCCWERPEQQTVSDADSRVVARAKLSNGCLVEVWCADALDGSLGVQAVVNSANVRLQHAGGIAYHIEQGAGANLTLECQQILANNNGELRVGQVVTTGAYNLESKGFTHVLHATPPAFSPDAHGPNQLKQTVLAVLNSATELDLESIVMPTLGAGIFNWPLEQAVECHFSGINDWLQGNPSPSLRRLILIDVKPENAKAMAARLRELVAGIAAPLDVPQPPELTQPPLPPLFKVPKFVWYWRQEWYKMDGVKEQYCMDKVFVAYDYDQIIQLEQALENNKTGVVLSGDMSGRPSDSEHMLPDQTYPTYQVYFDEHEDEEGKDYFAIQRNPASAFARGIRRSPVLDFEDAKRRIPLCAERVESKEKTHAWKMAEYEVEQEQRRQVEASRPSGASQVAKWLWQKAVDTFTSQVPEAKSEAAKAFSAVPAGDVLLIIGPPKELPDVEMKIRQVLTDAKKESEPIDLSRFLLTDADKDSLMDYLVEKGFESVDLSFDDAGCVRVQAMGELALHRIKFEVANWRSEKQDEQQEQLRAGDMVSYPEEWGVISPDEAATEGARFEEVRVGTDEYIFVEDRMRHVTGLDGLGPKTWTKTILKVERVINPVAFTAYHRQRLGITALARNNGECNEVWVKHGTSTYPTKELCVSPVGLDFRYCAAGMFGRAAYTAEDTVYSDEGYRYNLPPSNDDDPATAQLILVRAAAGKVCELPVGTRSRRLVKAEDGYDSVRGEVQTGSYALMFYTLAQAYPAYVVTYLT